MDAIVKSDQIEVPPRFLVFLRELPDTAASHTGRRLADHLIGTYRILMAWRSPCFVCKAGLFHSIYGTEAFPRASLDLDSRTILRRLIGKRAEALAYDFHLADWSVILRDQMLASALARSSAGLFEVAVANLVEQVPHLVAITGNARMFDAAAREHLKLEPWLSPASRDSLQRLIASLEAEGAAIGGEVLSDKH
jgi:hypothetical protein